MGVGLSLGVLNYDKLEILVEGKSTDKIRALFNPNQIVIQKTVGWREQPTATRDTPESQFTHGNAATLTLDLFFDTYEQGTNVTALTQKIADLTTVEKHGSIHRPPICQLSWGKFGVFFEGVVQSLTQTFTLFLEDGTPVRAKLACSFRQWRSKVEEAQAQNLSSPDVVKTYVFCRGDSLSSVAAQEYGDPTLWRPIAEANSIDDPRSVAPGTILVVPTLTAGTAAGG